MDSATDVHGGRISAGSQGGMVEGMSIREAARVFGLHRDVVRKMLSYSVPPVYRRQTPPKRPKLSPYTGVIDRILEDDLGRPRKQCSASTIFAGWRRLFLPVHLGCSLFPGGFLFQNHYPRFRGALSGCFKGCPQGRPSVDS